MHPIQTIMYLPLLSTPPPPSLHPSLHAHHMPHTHFSTGILGLRSTHYSFTFRWVLYCTCNVYEVKGSLWGILQFILSTQSSESMLLLGWQKYESKTSRRAPWSSWSNFTTIAQIYNNSTFFSMYYYQLHGNREFP